MSVQLKKYSHTDNSFGSVEAAETVWGVEPNVDLMHMAVVRQLNNQRLGTACTKTRTEVRGGGKKPWKQKGTGRARAGSRRSPVWRGGGINHGPRPRSFRTALNRKMSAKALSCSLSAVKDQVLVVEDAAFASHKTKDFLAALAKMEINTQGKILVLSVFKEPLYLATRNLKNVRVINPRNLGPVDVLQVDHILALESSLELLQGRLEK